MTKGFLTTDEREVFTHYDSVADAIVKGIKDLQSTGGGTLWIHHPSCNGRNIDMGCPCDPVPVDVEEQEAPN